MSTARIKLRVKEVVRETPDAVSIYFYHPDSGRLTYEPGQFLTLLFNIGGEETRRAYSLCTSPFTDEYPAVTIKRVDDGVVSNYINDEIKAGDEIEVLEPIGNFTTDYDAGRSRHVMLFGGGSGITPLMALAKGVLYKEPKSLVSLIYANRNEESVIFKDELNRLAEANPDRLKVVHVLDVPPEAWTGAAGYLTPELIRELLVDLHLEREHPEYFMCGPEPMMMIVTDSLNKLGVDKSRIHKESFFPPSAGKEESDEELREREVVVICDDEEHRFMVPPDQTILDAALDLDIDLPFSCQSGLCTACRGRCVSGRVHLDEREGLSDSEIEEGYVLTCVGHPLTDDVKIEIG